MMNLSLPIEDPLPAHRFLVTLNPVDAYRLDGALAKFLPLVAAGGFSEVTGLHMKHNVVNVAEGGVNRRQVKYPGLYSFENIVFKRGVTRGPSLFSWYRTSMVDVGGIEPLSGAIILLTPMGAPAMAWIFRGGRPVDWQGPDLKASTGAVAIERLEIAIEELEEIPLSLPRTGT